MSQRPRPRSGRRPPPRRHSYPVGAVPGDQYAVHPTDPSVAPYQSDAEYTQYAEDGERAPDHDQYAGYDEYAEAGAYADDDLYAEPDPYADYDDYEEPPYRVISPFRLLLFLLIAAAGAVAFFGIVIEPQLPLAVSGLGVMGVALVLLALSLAGAAAALGRRGRSGRSLFAALFGGLCALAGAGALSAAIVLGILAAGTA